MDPGGLPKKSKKVNERGCMQRFKKVRGNPLSTDLWRKPQTNDIHEYSILLQIDRLQPTSVHRNRREVRRQHLKRPVSQCEHVHIHENNI